MINAHETVALLSDPDLLARTRELIHQSHCTEADLLAHRGEIDQAQELLRHRVPDGDLACIVDKALDLLIERVKKERFAVGRKPRQSSVAAAQETPSRHIPDPIRRKVYERGGGRCTF